MTDRAQRAAETILTDPTLTDNLDDQPAQVLIDWSIDVAKQVADYTSNMGQQAALSHIEGEMVGVRRILRRVNSLYAMRADASLEEINAKLNKLYAGADDVTIVEARPIPDQTLIAEGVKNLPPSDGIRQILGQFVVRGAAREGYDEEKGLMLTTPDVEPGEQPIDTKPEEAGDECG